MKLSIREKEILDLLIKRKINKEIASTFFISEETVKKHLKNVYRKLGVRNRIEATLKLYKFR